MRPALFLHIQKTAGTSIVELAMASYGMDQVASHGDFVGRPPAALAGLSFVSGHFGFDYAAQLMDGRYSFTFLRDPVERVASHYYFVRDHAKDRSEVGALARTVDLEEFLASGLSAVRKSFVDNQTWQLASGHCDRFRVRVDGRGIVFDGGLSPDDFESADMLEAAKAHLDRFDFVGFAESADDDQLTICAALGIEPPPSPVAANANPARPEIDEATRRVIEPHVQLDLELLAHARSARAAGRARLEPPSARLYRDRITVAREAAGAPRRVRGIGVFALPRTGSTTLVASLQRMYRPMMCGVRDGRKRGRWIARAGLLCGDFGRDLVETRLSDRYIAIILRDPVDRVVSLYHSLRETDRDSSTLARLAHDLSLEAFVTDPDPAISAGIDDYQTRRLAGIGHDGVGGPAAAEAVETALAQLQCFDHVGFTESLQSSIDRVLSDVGAPAPPIRLWLRRGADRPSAAEISDATRDKITARTRLDHELVERARALVASRGGPGGATSATG